MNELLTPLGLFWLTMAIVNTLLAGIFAGAETGVYRLNRMRLELACESGQSSARILRGLLDSMDNALAMLLIGTNIHQYLAVFAISTLFILGGAGDQSEWYTTLLATPLLFVLKDSVPKTLFQKSPDRLMRRVAWPLRCFDWLYKLTGLTWLVRGFTQATLWLLRQRGGVADASALGKVAELLAEGQAVGALRPSQRQMAHRVMNLPARLVGEVTQPLDVVATISADATRAEFITALKDVEYSRLVATDPDGKYIGIINVYDVLMDRDELAPRHWMRSPLWLKQSVAIPVALYTLQRAKHHLAIVLDDNGKQQGVITIKDLIEPIVGTLNAW